MNGSTMIASTKPGGQQPDAEGRPSKQLADQRQIAQVRDQPRLHECCSTGASTNSPQMPNTMLGTAASSSMAVDDRRAQPQRTGLGQEYRDAERERHRDQHRDQRGDDGAIERRQRAKLLGDRIPDCSWSESRT